MLVGLSCAVGLAAACVGCSSSGIEELRSSLHDLGISDKPGDVMATALERIDASSKLGADLNRRYARVQFAVRGWSWADADCAAGKLEEVVTPAAFAALTVGELETIKRTRPETEEAAHACASPASAGRVDAAQPKDATTATNAAPDIDGAEVKAVLTDFYRHSADQLGLTPAESDCVVDHVLGPRSDADMVEYVTGASTISASATAPQVMSCFTDSRLEKLVPAAGRSLLAQKEAAKAEHDRVQAEIDRQVDEAVNGTTTVP